MGHHSGSFVDRNSLNRCTYHFDFADVNPDSQVYSLVMRSIANRLPATKSERGCVKKSKNTIPGCTCLVALELFKFCADHRVVPRE